MLAHAGEAVDELCKPSPSVESVQGRTKEFLKSVEVGVVKHEWAGWGLMVKYFQLNPVVTIELNN